MANICTTNYVIEGKKEELDALYQKMKELQDQDLGQLVKAPFSRLASGWIPTRGPSIRSTESGIIMLVSAVHPSKAA